MSISYDSLGNSGDHIKSSVFRVPTKQYCLSNATSRTIAIQSLDHNLTSRRNSSRYSQMNSRIQFGCWDHCILSNFSDNCPEENSAPFRVRVRVRVRARFQSFKVFVKNVTKAGGTSSNESIHEKKEMKELSVHCSFVKVF